MSIAIAPQAARLGDYIQTYTGRKFWPLDPHPDDIDLQDIAHALSNQCRFSGHSRQFYSVAEHSVRVMALCGDESEQRWGLMHDAAEAYLSDLPRPIKHLRIFQLYRESEDILMAMIAEKFGLAAMTPVIKSADNIMLASEVRDLMTPDRDTWGKWLDGVEPIPWTIHPMSPKQAKHAFLAHAGRLGLT